MAAHPYAMAAASASVHFPMPSTGRAPLHAIWESDTASINQDLPNPYDNIQQAPDPPQHLSAGPAYQRVPRAPPVHPASSNRPHTVYAARPQHVAHPAPGPIIRSPRSMADMNAIQGRRMSPAVGGDYFSRVPGMPFPEPRRAPPLRHTQSSPPPVPRKPHLSQPSAPPMLAHSFPVPALPRNASYPHVSPLPSQSHAPHVTPQQPYITSQPSASAPVSAPRPHTTVPHAHHSLPPPTRHHHTDSAPQNYPYRASESPRPPVPPKPPPVDEAFTQAIHASLHETRAAPQVYDEDAALAQALKQSLADVGRSHSPPHRAPSSIAPSSSGHSTSTDSGYHTASSRMSSPYASPRHSSAPHPAFFPGHRSRGSSLAATPLGSPNPSAPGSTCTVDTAQALRMRSTSIETVLPKDISRRSDSANRDKPLPHSAPPTDRIPHPSPGGHARLTKRPARSQNDLTQGPSPRATQRLSVAVEAQQSARAAEPELTPVLDTPIVESPSPGRQNFDVDDAPPPSYQGPGPGIINEKDGSLSAGTAVASGSGAVASSPQQLIPQELLVGISMGFGTAPIASTSAPYQGTIPTLVSLPYGDKAPFYIQGPNWRSVLKFMARLPSTRVEPSIDALKQLKGEARLRIVVSFVKVHSASNEWITGVYMSIDVPVPVNAPNAARFRSGDSTMVPWSYTISAAPAVMRDGADGPLSKFYTIPSVPGNLYPTLPTTFPDLAMYLASALELSRNGSPEGYPGLRRLSKLVDSLYPEEHADMDADEKVGMRQKLKNFVGLGSKPQRSRNAEMYELVTPFVPDDYGR